MEVFVVPNSHVEIVMSSLQPDVNRSRQNLGPATVFRLLTNYQMLVFKSKSKLSSTNTLLIKTLHFSDDHDVITCNNDKLINKFISVNIISSLRKALSKRSPYCTVVSNESDLNKRNFDY